MSREPFTASPDLKRLRDEGYNVEIVGGYLVMHDVPYVNWRRHVQYASLISTLNMAGDVTARPDTDIVYTTGQFPHTAQRQPMGDIAHQGGERDLGSGLVSKHSLRTHPEGGFDDYHDKMTTFASILAGAARVLLPEVSPRTGRKRLRRPTRREHPFNYVDTASYRYGVGALSERFSEECVAIVGLGGTGSYVLDLVAKTPVREIRLFDADEFLQHNAFRTPGAATLAELRRASRKVDHLAEIYGRMHRRIVAHPVALGETNQGLLAGVTFAFICIDNPSAKGPIVRALEALGASFIDAGLGLAGDRDDPLGGIVRVTTSTPERRDHMRDMQIAPEGGRPIDCWYTDLYRSNAQVADLNALNAALAVIKWKKLRGFYRDEEREHHMTYTIGGNIVLNA